jgi:Na+/H+-dicarboxylate symporter
VVGLFFATLLKPTFGTLQTTGLSYEVNTQVNFVDTFVSIFPSNFFRPMVEANMLQVIVIALLFGFGIILAGEKAKPLAKATISVADVSTIVMEMILKLSPIGVFCLITPVVATNGPQVLGSLAMLLLTAYLCYAIHVLVVYSITLKTLGKMNPVTFFKGMMPAMIMAFSSASSVGTLPLNMECSQKLGAKREVVSFVLPLGATINMDGTAIYQGVAAVFIASCYGITLTLPQMIIIILTATLASIGTAGVPGAGMIMLAMVLQSVGLPIEGIALVAGVDRIFDMGRTTVNITGDAACALVVTRLEERKEARRAAKAQNGSES